MFFVVYNKTYIACLISLNIGFINSQSKIYHPPRVPCNICLILHDLRMKGYAYKYFITSDGGFALLFRNIPLVHY